MPLSSVMFCGAADTKSYLNVYFNVCRSLNLQKPVNFINGSFHFNQFGGPNAYELNSERTIDASDILIFVIKEDYGTITWDVEFEYAVQQGKNFIILCHQQTYDRYKMSNPDQLIQDQLLSKIAYLEVHNRYNQFSIVGYEEEKLEEVLIDQISQLFSTALKTHEAFNRRQSFINKHLYGTNFKNYTPEDITDKNEKLLREILFDPFEIKEIRKRAMEFFTFRKSLTQEELNQLCRDPEQGVARKALSKLTELVDKEKIDIGEVYTEIIHTVLLDGEVGLVRRCIKSLADMGALFAVKYFPLFFPADDVGTPKRIVRVVQQHWEELQQHIADGLVNKEELKYLLSLCLDKDGAKGEWKDVAKNLLDHLNGPKKKVIKEPSKLMKFLNAIKAKFR